MRTKALVAVLMMAVACGTAPSPADVQPPLAEYSSVAMLDIARVEMHTPVLKRLVKNVPAAGTSRAIRREVDVWRVDDGPMVSDVYLSGPSSEALAEYVRQTELPRGRELAYEPVDDGRWRTHVLITEPSLDETAVVRADASVDDGRPVVRLRLTPAGGARLHAMTSAAVGGKLAVRVDGTVIAAPVVRAPIIGDSVDITLGGDATAGDAERLAAALRGEG
jgi:hypothetical protein